MKFKSVHNVEIQNWVWSAVSLRSEVAGIQGFSHVRPNSTVVKHGLWAQRDLDSNTCFAENQDGGVGRHTAPHRTTRTDRESNSKGDQHQGNRK